MASAGQFGRRRANHALEPSTPELTLSAVAQRETLGCKWTRPLTIWHFRRAPLRPSA